MASLNFIDVSGLGNSGKGAVVDFLREFNNIYSPKYSFEFDLFRLPNGILDLHHHLCEDWSLIRSNYAIKSFEELCQLMAGDPRKSKIYNAFFSFGTGYECYFNSLFKSESLKYIDSFKLDDYKTFWPYYMLSDSPLMRFYKKILIKCKFKRSLMNDIYLTSGDRFSEKTTDFINNIYNAIIENDKNTVIFNNAFEPFNPVRSLNILNNSKSVIVYRDPRDIYVSGLNDNAKNTQDRHLKAFDNNGINKSFLGTDRLDTFIKRQKIFFETMYSGIDPRVKIIRFEDFILSFDDVANDIIEFLGLSHEQHTNKGLFFNKEQSFKNINSWKKFSNQNEIDIIYSELKKYCYEF